MIYGGSGNDAIIDNGSGDLTIDVPEGQTLALSGTNTTGALVETDSGTLILTGANLYGDGVDIEGGTLQLGDGETNNGSVAGVISGSGYLAVDGTLTLNEANTFTGTTTVNAAGSLTLGVGSALQDSTLDTSGGGAISFNSLITSAVLGGLQGSGGLGLQAMDLTVGGNNDNTVYSGILSGTADGSLTKTGSGTLTLTGDNSSTFLGWTQIDEGVLSISSDSNLGNPSDPTIIYSGGTLQAVGDVVLVANRVLEIGPGAVIDVPDGSTLTCSVPTDATTTPGSLTKIDGGTLFFNGVGLSSYSGTTDVQVGTLEAAAPADLLGYDTSNMIAVEPGATLAVCVGGSSDWNSSTNHDISDLLGSTNV